MGGQCGEGGASAVCQFESMEEPCRDRENHDQPDTTLLSQVFLGWLKTRTHGELFEGSLPGGVAASTATPAADTPTANTRKGSQ